MSSSDSRQKVLLTLVRTRLVCYVACVNPLAPYQACESDLIHIGTFSPVLHSTESLLRCKRMSMHVSGPLDTTHLFPAACGVLTPDLGFVTTLQGVCQSEASQCGRGSYGPEQRAEVP